MLCRVFHKEVRVRKKKLQAKNSQIFYQLLFLLTIAGLSSFSLFEHIINNLNVNFLLLHQVLLYGTYVIP